MKKRPIDINAVIYEYNTIVGTHTIQAKTITQVQMEMDKMDKDPSFLKMFSDIWPTRWQKSTAIQFR